MKNFKRILTFILLLAMLVSMFAFLTACRSGHAPGYGNTSKCTICGKKATHKTSNYGFCDKHWEDAIGR